MRGQGYQEQQPGMGFNDWMQVANSVSAIGNTIDRRRQNQRANEEQDRQKMLSEQSTEAFNYFVENPASMDFDNPEKQKATPSAIGEVAGVPTDRPKLPIEGLAPEAIAKGRLAAMEYWTTKKTLSRENLELTAAKAKQDRLEFIKGISHSATMLANDDEESATQSFVDSYNKYYPDGNKLKRGDQGNLIMVSPTGDERDVGKVDMTKMIDEFLASPDINDANFAKASIMSKRAIQELNRQAMEKPMQLYDTKTGTPYFAYTVIDPDTKDRTVAVMNMPAGMPGARTLTAEEITGLGLHTEDAAKFTEDRQEHAANMEVKGEQAEYYRDGKTKGRTSGASGKQTPEEKNAEKKQAAYDKAYAKIVARLVEEAGGIDGMTDQEMTEIQAAAEKEANLMTPGGSAIDQAKWDKYQDVQDSIDPDQTATTSAAAPLSSGVDKESAFQKAFAEKYQETNDKSASIAYAKQLLGIK